MIRRHRREGGLLVSCARFFVCSRGGTAPERGKTSVGQAKCGGGRVAERGRKPNGGR